LILIFLEKWGKGKSISRD